MEPIPETTDLSAYLAADAVIDHDHPQVRQTAAQLRNGAPTPYEYAKAAYTHVRDRVPHSFDSGDDRVVWRASDVLSTRNGICHAKSHALVALLRAEGIPAGLCYQRLTEDDGSDPVVHGLVALLLPGTSRWARQDARGNKPGVDARFSLDEERLAFPVRPELGERDYPTLYAAPPASVLDVLRGSADRQELAARLPEALD
ncbi:Transglutaminase-like superfamily protein [Actinacidiphila yanglinensis]|uniref:Transglutaminase-like superfamily protein n=1 Tax=Actinacidiphila yanglinensis TaxID=310779 RepID=A0A1H6DYW2_9ACTN|nr:transglutaminase family protein [Actinacidiphila yanglinensis]SEG89956.1 Transglutaminase-like superfamily protein [Actinacidiphila yanglinensis]